MIDPRELELADKLLKFRGLSLQGLIKRINDSDPDEPLCLCFKKMDFHDSVRASMIESELFPEKSTVYNSVEEAIKDSENW